MVENGGPKFNEILLPKWVIQTRGVGQFKLGSLDYGICNIRISIIDMLS